MTNPKKHPNLMGAGGFGEHSDSCPDPYQALGNECHEKVNTLMQSTMGGAESICSGDRVVYYPRDALQNVFLPIFMDAVRLVVITSLFLFNRVS